MVLVRRRGKQRTHQIRRQVAIRRVHYVTGQRVHRVGIDYIGVHVVQCAIGNTSIFGERLVAWLGIYGEFVWCERSRVLKLDFLPNITNSIRTRTSLSNEKKKMNYLSTQRFALHRYLFDISKRTGNIHFAIIGRFRLGMTGYGSLFCLLLLLLMVVMVMMVMRLIYRWLNKNTKF